MCASTAGAFSQSIEFGWFQFDSHPQGEVIFDDVSYGLTPVYVPVNVGSKTPHQAIIKISGYEEYYRELNENPKPGETILISLNTNLIKNIQTLLRA